jgi:xanthine dehydrogenase YagT iron-sulfur-binding subunit
MPPTDTHQCPREGFAISSRRGFLGQLGTAGLAAAAPLSARPASPGGQPEEYLPASAVPVTLRVNGVRRDLQLDPRTTLLDALREHLHLTGTKKGCDHGQCGACTVHVEGRRTNSCLCLAVMHEGDQITTIEGLGTPEKLHPMQASFLACDAYQCGFCTPGQIMSATALMKEPCGPSDGAVKEAMSGNICRCGAYVNILEAIQTVRKAG